MNRYLQTIVVAPVTSSSKPYPTRVEINLKKTKGGVVLDKIRRLDRLRITKIIEPIPTKEIAVIKDIIKETYVD
jgi:mRNA interferase MazF